VVAVTGQSWLRAVWAEEEVEITNSKVDFIFADARAAQRLPKPPAQPSEAQMLELLTDMQGIYEAKPSKHVQGTYCCKVNVTALIACMHSLLHVIVVNQQRDLLHCSRFALCRERHFEPVVTNVC